MKTQADKPTKGTWTNVPAWLSDPEGIAPCFCGRPLQFGEPHIVATGEHDMKRWFHAVCWHMLNDEDDWDWDDEDDE